MFYSNISKFSDALHPLVLLDLLVPPAHERGSSSRTDLENPFLRDPPSKLLLFRKLTQFAPRRSAPAAPVGLRPFSRVGLFGPRRENSRIPYHIFESFGLFETRIQLFDRRKITFSVTSRNPFPDGFSGFAQSENCTGFNLFEMLREIFKNLKYWLFFFLRKAHFLCYDYCVVSSKLFLFLFILKWRLFYYH